MVSETQDTERNAKAFRNLILSSGDSELIRNLETANTIRLGEDFFRTCVARDDRPADFVFQCSDNTWQAYNKWPDNHSLYTNDRADGKVLVGGVRVSYDRPYGKYVQIYDNPLSQGSGEFLLWEFPLAFWMEAQGYDVTYCSNTDVHAELKCLLRARAFLSVGHDEYWSRQQFDNVLAGVKAGVNVAFLSGNTCCFVAPLSASSDGVANRVLTRAGRYGGKGATRRRCSGGRSRRRCSTRRIRTCSARNSAARRPRPRSPRPTSRCSAASRPARRWTD